MLNLDSSWNPLYLQSTWNSQKAEKEETFSHTLQDMQRYKKYQKLIIHKCKGIKCSWMIIVKNIESYKVKNNPDFNKKK